MKNKKYINSLYKTAYDLWKEVAFARDGRRCMVEYYYPKLNIRHSSKLQVDHCFSRADKNLFFYPKNSLVVCASCNLAKKFDLKSVNRLIDKIVMHREGIEIFDEMLYVNITGLSNKNWMKKECLEAAIFELSNYLKEIKNGRSDREN